MSDLRAGEPDDARDPVRMAALSLLLHQVMKRPPRPGYPTGAWQRMGGDLSGLVDGLFGRSGATSTAASPSGLGQVISGMQGLLHEMREHGLGRQVESWIGHGPNLQVSAQELARVLDADEVAAMARQSGTDRETLMREAAALLPDFVHRMTPTGRLPTDAAEVQGGLGGVLAGLLPGAHGGSADQRGLTEGPGPSRPAAGAKR